MESLSSLFPTDNLYKFLAITGLLTFGFCFFYPDYREYQMLQRLTILKGEVEVVNLRLEMLRRNRESIMEDVGKLESMVADDSLEIVNRYGHGVMDRANISNLLDIKEKLLSKNYREYFEFLIKYEKDINPTINKWESLYNKFTELEAANDTLRLLATRQTKLAESADLESSRIEKIKTLGSIGRLIGALILIIGFTCWYIFAQSLQDKLLKYQVNEFIEKQENNKRKIIL